MEVVKIRAKPRLQRTSSAQVGPMAQGPDRCSAARDAAAAIGSHATGTDRIERRCLVGAGLALIGAATEAGSTVRPAARTKLVLLWSEPPEPDYAECHRQ